MTSPAYRTTFGAGISGTYNLGVILVYILGAFVDWRLIAGVSAAFPILGWVLVWLIPETPHYYVLEGLSLCPPIRPFSI